MRIRCHDLYLAVVVTRILFFCVLIQTVRTVFNPCRIVTVIPAALILPRAYVIDFVAIFVVNCIDGLLIPLISCFVLWIFRSFVSNPLLGPFRLSPTENFYGNVRINRLGIRCKMPSGSAQHVSLFLGGTHRRRFRAGRRIDISAHFHFNVI